MPASSAALRPLVPAVAAAFLGTALLAAWIRFRPLPMPLALQVALSAGVVVAVAVMLALVHRIERDADEGGGAAPDPDRGAAPLGLGEHPDGGGRFGP
jgi:hypothetical protein